MVIATSRFRYPVLLSLIVAIFLAFTGQAAVASDPGTVVATVDVGIAPYGVAVNTTTNRIYVTKHDESNIVSVIDATNSVIDTINV